MKIINLEQGSPEWLQWRQTRITATDAGIILDVNPWESILDLWESKLGLKPPKETTAAMQRGHELEPVARKLFNESMVGENYQPLVIEGDGDDYWMGASLDGINQDRTCICEIKCPKLETHVNSINYDEDLDLSFAIPVYYYSQMQHQMYTANVEWCYYVSYNPDYIEKPLQVLLFQANADYQMNMYGLEREFYFENMVKGKSPIWEFNQK